MISLKKTLLNDLNRFNKVPKKKTVPFVNSLKIWKSILRYTITSQSFRSIFFYRILNRQFYEKKRISKLILFLSMVFCRIEIPYTAQIGEGLLIPHPQCIIISRRCIIGKNATIGQGVTIGGNIYKTKNGARSPTIGDNVLISAGAKVLGPVEIGDNSIIGANSVVINDVPSNSVAVGAPAKVVKKVEVSFIEMQEKFRSKN